MIGAATFNSGDLGQIAAGLTGKYLDSQVFTMSQEKNADELGFSILADSSYNVGGAALAMEVIKNKYGDTYREGFGKILNPNDHPKTSQFATLIRVFRKSCESRTANSIHQW